MSQDAKRLGPPDIDGRASALGAHESPTVTEQATPRLHAPVPVPRRSVVTGARIGRYVVEELLGRGGMADVFAAHDTTLDRRVALKILRGVASDDARRQLLREAKLAARFEHPGSIVIYDVGEVDGVGFIAMEIVRGVPMSKLTRDPDVPLERRLLWLVGAARALAAAHAAGLVHRDVKPSNLMIRESGDVKVLDFGIARAHEPQIERSGEPSSGQRSFVGTLRYAAPEAFAGRSVDARADQFSWGLVAWELLAEHHPLPQDPMDAVAILLRDGVPPLEDGAPDLPIQICQVVNRALAKRPQDRYASLDEAADELEPIALGMSRSSRASFAEIAPAPVEPSAAPVRSSASETSQGAATIDAPPGPSSLAEASKQGHSERSKAARPAASEASRKLRVWGLAALAGIAVGLVVLFARRSAEPQAGAASIPAVSQAPAEIDAIGCSDAVIVGDDMPELPRALGHAACARLAPEVGVEWIPSGAGPSLEVRVDIQPSRAVATLRIAGREAVGTAAVPIVAVQRAVTELARHLRSPAWPPERVRLWGALDEASARRIFRVWWLTNLGVMPDPSTAVKHLLETDGDSPMPHLIALKLAVGGRDAIDGAPPRILERLDRVPQARADAIRGILLLFPAETDRKQGVRLLRESYAAAPDDHAMTLTYAGWAVRYGLPEASAIIDRLHEQAPQNCLGALLSGAGDPTFRDDARAARYMGWLGEIFPETLGHTLATLYFVSAGRFDDARRGLDLTHHMGLDGAAGDPLFNADARAQIELASLHPAAAREHIDPMLADPRFFTAFRGGLALAASHLLDGHLHKAETVFHEQAERLRDQGDGPDAGYVALAALRLSRFLDRPSNPSLRALAENLIKDRRDLSDLEALGLKVELALLSRDATSAEAALRDLEREAAAAEDAVVRDRVLVLAVPLCRVARGNPAAAALWQRTERAPRLARRALALDAALALEATRDLKAAREAYMIAADPSNNAEDAPQRVLALARLAQMDRRAGGAPSPGSQAAQLEALWRDADPDLLAAVARMR